MGDGARLRTCPGCGQQRIVRWSRTAGKWLWETHKKNLTDKNSKNCRYSGKEYK